MPSVAEPDLPPSALRSGQNGLPRVHVAEIQRNRMLAAAIDAVAEVGYSRLTVAQVIARARVSRKTFYDAFADREACFLAVFDEATARAAGEIAAAYRSHDAWRDAVRAGLARLLEMIDEERPLARLFFVDALGAGETVLARRSDVLRRATDALDGGRLGPRGGREPPPITSEALVGAVSAVVHNRLAANDPQPLVPLLGPLMSTIVLPYLGARAAERELTLPSRTPELRGEPPAAPRPDPLTGLKMRLTYRTVRVLSVIAEHPGASNREVAERAGIADQGQISKLLTRLSRLELIRNVGGGQERGAANAWHLTRRGMQVERAARPR